MTDVQRGNESLLELSIVIPTYNEKENIAPLIAALDVALETVSWELVFVDDNSPDGTGQSIREIARRDRRVHILERIARRGLSSACIEGMLATSAPYIAIMDGDLQHDEAILPQMLHLAKSELLDVVIATRKSCGGYVGVLSGYRRWLSESGTWLSKKVLRVSVSDPMSGFFLVSRVHLEEVAYRLTGTGFKILVDLLASSGEPARLGEVLYSFRERQHGKSKLDLNVELEYVFLLIDKIVGNYIPTRFVVFVLVGAFGLAMHLVILGVFYFFLKADFLTSQTAATFAAMTANFILNNMITFRDLRLTGIRFFSGLLTFYLACTVGVAINLGVGAFLLRHSISWYIAGLAGMAITSVWNYGVNSILTWRRHLDR